MIRNYLFDLDGTLTNPEKGITTAVRYALKKYGIEENDQDRLRSFIGPPLWNSFQKYYGFSAVQAEQAVTFYREYYLDMGIRENYVYDGIPELLESLCAEGKRLWVATSKPTLLARQVTDGFELTGYFEEICGIEMNDMEKTKGQVIADLMEKYGLNPDETVMIGDRSYDIAGGRENKLRTIGVTWGFGPVDELLLAGATALAQSPDAVKTAADWWTEHPNAEPMQPPAGFPPMM